MSKIKKIIIILLIILIIAIIGLITILSTNKKDGNDNSEVIEQESEGGEVITRIIDNKLENVISRSDYYTIKDCVGKYYSYYSTLFNVKDIYQTEDKAIISQAEEDNGKILYNILDKEYTQQAGITSSNIKTKFKTIKRISIDVNSMYVIHKTDNLDIYVVNGKLKEGLTNICSFQVIVKQDISNQTFSIIPQDYIETHYKNLTQGTELNIETDENIEQNENNTYEDKNASDEIYVKDLFRQYKNEILYNTESAYESLDEEYRTKKFDDEKNFKNYVQKNKDKYSQMQVVKYLTNVTDKYTEYVCIDQNGKYYIFREIAVMDYKVVLDTYTIDLPEFTKKYEEASEVQKVGLNVQKVFDAINDGDYKYAYSKLDNTFKANNFRTEAEFERYAKNNFYTNNTIQHDNCQKNGDLYMYDITITNTSDKNQNKINKKFIVKLKEGTDFVMSFNVK